jgi:glycosyltransferase involved in cell wall biosynthesis
MTSLIDATSSVLHEALSHGLPVVCHEACGFADVVNDDCAVLVPPHSPGQSIRAFTHALTRLARDANYYNHLAEGAHARARQVTVAHRARQMLAVYERVLGRTIVYPPDAPVVLRLASA